jgi:uncharacterized RDD family membrane protein YckC
MRSDGSPFPERPAPITDWQYAGLSPRLLATIIGLPIFLVAQAFFGIGGFLYLWLMIGLRGQTLGKMVVGIRVVDARGEIPDLGRAALREIVGKWVSSLFLLLGFVWVLFDPRKQGWHDKIAGTYAVRVPPGFGSGEGTPPPLV